LRGCQARDHKVKIRSERETDIFRVIMAHRDAACASKKTAAGLKADPSVTAAKPISSQHAQMIYEDLKPSQNFLLLPSTPARSLIDKSFWERALKSSPMFSHMTRTNADGHEHVNLLRPSSASGFSSPRWGAGRPSLASTITAKITASRWRRTAAFRFLIGY